MVGKLTDGVDVCMQVLMGATVSPAWTASAREPPTRSIRFSSSRKSFTLIAT